MITTVQFLDRIARRSRTGDFTELVLNEQYDCLQAANAALQALYDALPAYLKEQTQGFTLPAPMAANISVTSGSTAVPQATFTVAQIGQSIAIAGDPSWNQILGPAILRNPYAGPTSGVQGATIYGDAVYSQTFPFDRVIGNPKFSDPGSAAIIPIEMSRTESDWNWLFQSSIGRPMTWWPQYMGNSQGADSQSTNPYMVLKFAPAPDQAYSINVRLAFWPVRLLFPDVTANTALTVPDQIIDNALIPLGVWKLMQTVIWKTISPEDDARCVQAGIDAVAWCRNQIADPAAPANRAYTPLGY